MKKRIFSVCYMFCLTLLFTSIVSAVKVINEDRIERNQRIKERGIILQVLGIPVPAQEPENVMKVFDERVKTVHTEKKTVYVGYEKGGEAVKGYAFAVGGAGFWGPIEGMVAVDQTAKQILGISFYRHSETPGLGGRITEKWFTDQFRNLPLSHMGNGRKIFYLNPPGPNKKPNELDGITGATGTSRAVESFLNRELDRFLRDVEKSGTIRTSEDEDAKTTEQR